MYMSEERRKIKGIIQAISISEEKGTKKKNVNSALLKKDFGIVGDAHAGSKRQVSLLAEESIEKMRLKGLNVAPGDFAENITTKGIDLLNLKVSTRLKAGKEAILEITQFGKTCHTRCNIYYQAGDCVMPKEGVFVRVIKGGVIKPQDELEVIKDAKRTIVERSPERAQRVEGYKVAVLTISDKCSKGQREDKSGKIVQEFIKNLPGEVIKYEIIPDEPDMIKERLINYCDNLKVDLVLTNGGTGFTARDFTPEATKEVIEKEVPGIPEAMRVECLKFTKRAMLSRAVSGIRGKTLIVNLPGSASGAKESLEAILEGLPHGLDMIAGKEH